jgi:hypothetical protein
VDIMAFNANGTPALAAPVRVRVVGGGQMFTDDIVGQLGLGMIFSGSMTFSSDAPVLMFNQERANDNTGATVPVHPR